MITLNTASFFALAAAFWIIGVWTGKHWDILTKDNDNDKK